MFYIGLSVVLLVWAAIVIWKGRFSWHSVLSIYVLSVIVVDYGDEVFDYWLDLYDLPARLLDNPASDQYLGLVLSDGVIFPLIAVIFCFYAVRFRRPWLLSAIAAPPMALIELALEKTGYMVLFFWSHFVTLGIAFFGFRILAHSAGRLVHYSPPVSYRFWLVGVVYTCLAWPLAVFSWGMGHLFRYAPGIFADFTADDRLISLLLITLLGGVAALFAPRIRPERRIFLYLGLGLCCFLFAMVMYGFGLLVYNHWNHGWMFVLYMAPCLPVYWLDRWESKFRAKLAPGTV